MNLFIIIIAAIGILLIGILYWQCKIEEQKIKEEEKKWNELKKDFSKIIHISDTKPKRKYKKRKKPVVVAEKRPVGRPRKTTE